MCLITKRNDGPFVDIGRDFDFDHQGRMYISHSAIRDLGHMIGMVDQGELDLKDQELEEIRALNNDLAKQVEKLEKFKQAVTVIKRNGFKAEVKQEEAVANGG